MKKCIVLLISTLLFFSCQKKSELSATFNCSTNTLKNLEKVEDLKSVFSIDLPKDWKINLYQDEIQSSIFTADTTKQLTETVLLDVTYINKKIDFNDDFLLKQQQENLSKKLIQVQSKKITFKEKPTVVMHFKGRKGNFDYQVCNTFIKLNTSNFLLAKVEVYGDALVNERFCKAIESLDNIIIKRK